MKVLHSICQQIWKTQQWPQDWKRSVFIQITKKGNAKEYSNYHTIALISHTSKVMLKILQARLQQYVNCELLDVQAGFRKGRGTRDQIANICWCWGPLMDGTWWSGVDDKKVKERKRLIFLGLHRKPIKPLAWGLFCSRRPQAPSQRGEGAERLHERVLEAWAGKWTQRASTLQRSSLGEREKERERKRKNDMGTRALMEQRCFIFTRYLFSAEIKSKLTSYQENMRSSIWKREL